MDFDYQPVLKGELLTLRPLVEDDFDGLFDVASDPAIWEQHPVADRYREPVFRRFFLDALASGGTLVATDAADGRIIGSSRFHGYSAERREVEIAPTGASSIGTGDATPRSCGNRIASSPNRTTCTAAVESMHAWT